MFKKVQFKKETYIADGTAEQVSTCTATASSSYVCCSMSTSIYCNQVTSCFKSYYNPTYDYSRYPSCLNTANGVGDYGCFVKIHFCTILFKKTFKN